jgi:hypothetical protein
MVGFIGRLYYYYSGLWQLPINDYLRLFHHDESLTHWTALNDVCLENEFLEESALLFI